MIALPLAICGCQSSSTPPIQAATVQCQSVAAPAAWFMKGRAPNLPWRMFNEFSLSPIACDQGQIALVTCQASVREVSTAKWIQREPIYISICLAM